MAVISTGLQGDLVGTDLNYGYNDEESGLLFIYPRPVYEIFHFAPPVQNQAPYIMFISRCKPLLYISWSERK